MRVLVWYWGRRGAGAQYTLQIVRALRSVDDVEVFVSVSNANPLADQTVSLAHGAQVKPVHSLRGVASTLFDPRRTIGSYARQVRADVVLHCMISPHTLFGWRTLRKIPVVTVVHDPAPHPGDEKRIADAAWRMALRRSARIVAPSQHVGHRLRLLTNQPVDVVPFGPLLDVGADLHWDSDGPITFVGRLLPYNGLDMLAEAWAEAAPQHCRLVVAGESSPATKSVVEHLRDVGATVSDRWLSDQDLIATIAGSRALVLPYLEASQSGLIPIAHAMGIPVLATNVGALPEQVGKGGWLVNATVADLSAGLKTLMHLSLHEISAINFSVGPKWTEIGPQMATTLRLACQS